MKTIKIISAFIFFNALSLSIYSQDVKTETFKVSGNCGMCKNTIEKAAKSAGVSFAEWNKETKVITVKYDASSSNLAKIQESIAGVGYDNEGLKAADATYSKLPACCKYERLIAETKKDCCDNSKCSETACQGMECCKDKDGCKKNEKGNMN